MPAAADRPRRLHVGLTGGMGAGKSTVSAVLAELGATVVDSDRIAREVVEPGRPGLDQVVAAFGPSVLDAEERLDRPTLGRLVFGDSAALARLNAIVHPLVRARSAELVGAADDDAVVVHDIPLLVENGLAAQFALVVVVQADLDRRIARMLASRPLSEADLRARIAAQSDDAERAAVADVVLDNSGTAHDLADAVRGLWADRLRPYADNLAQGRAAAGGADPHPDGPAVRRASARVWYLVDGTDGVTVESEEERVVVAVPDGRPDPRPRLADGGWYPPTDTEAPAPGPASVTGWSQVLRSADPDEAVRLELRLGRPRP